LLLLKNIKNEKTMVKWIGIIVISLLVIGSAGYFYLSGYFAEGNDEIYSVAKTDALPNSPIAGKTILFLGSSVTEGFAAHDESFVDYIQKRNNCICIKEAKSGTTMLDNGESSFVQRILKFDTKAKADAFVCQLSTNDTRYNGLKKLGSVSESKDPASFDKTTTTGALEYIITYVRKTWNCPVVFLTNTYFKNDDYQAVVKRLYDLKAKWGIEVIDLYNDEQLNKIPKDSLDFYMLGDHVHPHRAGYKLWWTPAIEKKLYPIVIRQPE
jgi:lysophospholipase L1-like esterase